MTYNLNNKNVLNLQKQSGDNEWMGALGDCYEITEAEATRAAGTLTEKENGVVEVNSETTGVTFLKGTITCDDKDVVMDAENSTVYTSVMWNPISNAEATNDGFIAFEGQDVTVKAQLVDKNGNAVASADKNITWGVGTDTLDKAATDKKISVVKNANSTKTDKNGQASLKLRSENAVELIGMKASTDAAYDVVLTIGGKTVGTADIYWINFYLQFARSAHVDDKGNVAGSEVKNVTKTDSANGEANVDVAANVDETWEYAVEGISDSAAFAGGVLKGCTVTAITDFVPAVKLSDWANGEAKTDAKGVTTVTAKTTGRGGISHTVDSTTKLDGAKIHVYDPVTKDTTAYTLAGEGATTADEKLTIGYTYNPVGTGITFDTSFGVKYSTANAKNYVYIKANDKNGNSLGAGKHILVKADGTSIADPAPDATTHLADAETDADGIARVEIGAFDAGKEKATITASLKDDADVVSTLTIYKAVPTKLFYLNGAKIDEGKNAIVLTFSDNIEAKSVVKEQFGNVEIANTSTLSGTPNYTVSGVEVSGNTITLKLNHALSGINDNTIFAVGYKPCSFGKAGDLRNKIYAVTSAEGVSLYGGAAADTINTGYSQADSNSNLYDAIVLGNDAVAGTYPKATGNEYDESGAKPTGKAGGGKVTYTGVAAINTAIDTALVQKFKDAVAEINTTKSIADVKAADTIWKGLTAAQQSLVSTERNILVGYIDEINLLGEGVTGSDIGTVTKTAIAAINAEKYVYDGTSGTGALDVVSELTTKVNTEARKGVVGSATLAAQPDGVVAKGKQPTDALTDGDTVVYTLKTTTGFTKDVTVTVLSAARGAAITSASTKLGALDSTKTVAAVDAFFAEYKALLPADQAFVTDANVTIAVANGLKTEVEKLREAEKIIRVAAGFSAGTYSTDTLLDAHIQDLIVSAGLSANVTVAPGTVATGASTAVGTRAYTITSKTTTTLTLTGVDATIVP